MERDAKYAVVAAFALLAIAAAVLFVLWYSGRGDRHENTRYEIYFDGSVSGLARGSPVRYLGVDVGRVEKLALDRAHPGRVKVLVDVDVRAPITGATQARLGLLGLTGLLYIDLQTNPAGNQSQALVKGEEFLVIPSRQGDIEAFLAKLPDLLGHVAGLTERLEVMMSDANIASVTETLNNLQTASDDLPAITHEASSLIADLRTTSTKVTELASSLNGLTAKSGPQLDATLASTRAAVEKLGRTADSLDRIVSGNEATLSHFAGSGVSDLQQLIIDLRETSEEMRTLAHTLRDNPTGLLIEHKESGLEIPP